MTKVSAARAKLRLWADQQNDDEQQVCGGQGQARVDQTGDGRLRQPEHEGGGDGPADLSHAAQNDNDQRLQSEDDADGGIKREEHGEQGAAARRHRAADGECEGRSPGYLDGDQVGRRRIDGDRPQGQPGTGMVQPQNQHDAKCGGGAKRGNPVQAIGLFKDDDGAFQIGIAEVITAEDGQHQTDKDETQTKGGEDTVDFKLAAAFRPPHQWRQKVAVDAPIQNERQRDDHHDGQK